MKLFNSLPIFAGLALSICFASQVNAEAVYASYGGSQLGVTIRDVNTLNQYVPLSTAGAGGGVAATGIAVDSENHIFLPSANHLRKYNLDGALLIDFTFPDASVVYSDVAVRGNNVYAAYRGSQQGVSIRNATNLAQTSFFATGVNAEGIAADDAGSIYLSFGNTMRKYSSTGAQLATMTFPDAGIVYTSLVVKNGKVYATYRGSQQGVTIRNANTLNQLNSFNTGVNASGIGFDTNSNSIFISAGNRISKYSESGILLDDMVFPISTINYTGITIK